ncbi:MAG TPA: four helix bundle protein [Kiritimatiellia bacterium]|nr:four helix bundle protein [Kiritimatiellia bacterium]
MKYERFEDVPVWQAAADLAARLFEWSDQPAFRRKGDLANQLQRAGLSISNNIAEGFERGTSAELITFLYYARGSAGEVRSMLCVMSRMPAFTDLKSEISNFKSHCESISRQIRGWTNALQNSDIKGQRYLNDQTRRAYTQKKQGSAFLDQLKRDHEERLRRLAEQRNLKSEI